MLQQRVEAHACNADGLSMAGDGRNGLTGVLVVGDR